MIILSITLFCRSNSLFPHLNLYFILLFTSPFFSRTIVSVASGCCAGALGIASYWGIVFFVLVMVISSLALLVKANFDVEVRSNRITFSVSTIFIHHYVYVLSFAFIHIHSFSSLFSSQFPIRIPRNTLEHHQPCFLMVSLVICPPMSSFGQCFTTLHKYINHLCFACKTG